MRKIIYLFACVMLPALVHAQSTVINTGNWDDPSTWSAGAIASSLSDDVLMTDGVTVTVTGVPGNDTFDVGSFTAGLNNQLSIAVGGHLGVGDAGNPRNFNAGTAMTITAAGQLIIWGDLIVSNNLIMTISGVGEIIVKGNVVLANNATLTVNGNLQVGGDFTGGNNTNVVVNSGASINVDGTLAVGPGSNVILNCDFTPGPTNCGTFHAHACGPAPAGFCSTLPVELIFFRATAELTTVKLMWATASEINFDHFIIEKSRDGKVFTEVATVSGSVNSRQRNDYTIVDEKPLLGKSYYRLKEVDLDGSMRFLKLAMVNFTGARSLSLFPNPLTGGDLNIELNFVPEQEVLVTIVDLRGITLSEFRLSQQNVKLPVQLPSGAYVVMLQSNGFRSVSKLMVR